jgi:general secretion pathway protein L
MSVLVIFLPPRPRGGAPAEAPAEYAYVLSNDGTTVLWQGRGVAADLPLADSVCAVLPEADLSWHRVAVPKAPAARLRAALGAVLEDQLLDDEAELHLALEPGLGGGQTGWVAVTRKDWLATLIGGIEQAGVPLDRVLPLSWPGPTPSVHALPADDAEASPVLVWSHADGVACLRMAGGLARQRLAASDRAGLVCSAHPGAAAAVERWLEAPVQVVPDAERALQALRSPWNLRQFDLMPRHRGMLAVRDALRKVSGPDWRPVRLGLLALLGLQVVGLNAWAWQLDRATADKRRSLTQLLQTAHPQVRAVLDAPLQMQKETEQLRSRAGRAGPTDLEPLLALAATAWPTGQPPMQALRFEPGRLTVTAAGWAEPQRKAFADRVRAAGYTAESKGDQVVLSRGGRP